MIKALLQRTALVCGGIVAALLALELATRLVPSVFLPSALQNAVQEMESRARSLDPYLPDPYLWYVIRPGTDFEFKHPDRNFRIKTNLNFPRAGFRGGTLGGPAWGIAVGDSFTFGLGVNHEETWIAHLAKLAQREIVNLGVPGWGPQQYTRTIERYGIPLNPKIVFYGLFSNDPGNITRFEKRDGHFNEFSLRKFMRLHSITFNLSRKVRRSPRQDVEDIDLGEPGFKFSSEQLIRKFDSDSKRLPRAWPLAAREIEEALQKTRKSNATFILLYFPSKEEVYWDRIKKEAPVLEAYHDRIEYLKKTTLAFCESRQIFCIDVTPALRKRASEQENVYFPIDNHWNEQGNRIVAEEIYRALRAKKIL